MGFAGKKSQEQNDKDELIRLLRVARFIILKGWMRRHPLSSAAVRVEGALRGFYTDDQSQMLKRDEGPERVLNENADVLDGCALEVRESARHDVCRDRQE